MFPRESRLPGGSRYAHLVELALRQYGPLDFGWKYRAPLTGEPLAAALYMLDEWYVSRPDVGEILESLPAPVRITSSLLEAGVTDPNYVAPNASVLLVDEFGTHEFYPNFQYDNKFGVVRRCGHRMLGYDSAMLGPGLLNLAMVDVEIQELRVALAPVCALAARYQLARSGASLPITPLVFSPEEVIAHYWMQCWPQHIRGQYEVALHSILQWLPLQPPINYYRGGLPEGYL